MIVITNHKPLSFKEEKATAVPLKMRKGIKNNNRLFNAMLRVNAALRKSIGKLL